MALQDDIVQFYFASQAMVFCSVEFFMPKNQSNATIDDNEDSDITLGQRDKSIAEFRSDNAKMARCIYQCQFRYLP